ncbi:hypothetical protein GTY62_02035 [Streptomyces sp. SID724]|uniref:hypothetical protein n=1 Tax=Streptomyces sp. SID724 TaxID=2690324 RepID=UPI0013612CC9|nr:hypothetical protein [Streptomyces sp. SID724]
MRDTWGPDRGVLVAVRVSGLAGLAAITAGALTSTMWFVGVGVWAMIVAFLTELVYRP